MGGTAAGWLCGQEDWTTLFSVEAGLGMLAAALVITGFYPLTQLYQREDDRRRGDITFAVRWGERCFPVAIGCMALAGLLMGSLIGRRFGPWEGLVVIGGFGGLAALITWWWRHFDESQVRKNYVQMMRVGYLMTGGFLGFIGCQLIRGG
jgi:1,4-dihydroxy-2-naphthoate octaprenyltransferase